MYVDMACRALLTVVFAFAIISKLRGGIAEFAVSLTALGIRRFTRTVACAVVVAEAGTVILLVMWTAGPVGYVAAIGLLGAFMAGIGVAMRTRRQVNCRCFGTSGQQLGMPHLVRNLALVVVAITGLAAGALAAGAGAMSLEALLAVAAGTVLSPVFVYWDELVFAFTFK